MLICLNLSRALGIKNSWERNLYIEGLGTGGALVARARPESGASARRVLSRTAAVVLALGFALNLLAAPLVRYIAGQVRGQALPAARRLLPEPTVPEPTASGHVLVVLETPKSKSAWVLKNGEEVGDFSGGMVRVEVRNGDLLEIDGGVKRERRLFRVVETSANVLLPLAGDTIVTEGSIEILARVKIE